MRLAATFATLKWNVMSVIVRPHDGQQAWWPRNLPRIRAATRIRSYVFGCFRIRVLHMSAFIYDTCLGVYAGSRVNNGTEKRLFGSRQSELFNREYCDVPAQARRRIVFQEEGGITCTVGWLYRLPWHV